MSDVIADLELKVSSTAKGSTDAIDKLSESLKGLKASLEGFSDGYESTFTGLANGLSQLKAATTGWNTRSVNAMSASLDKLASSADEVNRKFSVMKDGMIIGETTGITALADALKGFSGFAVDPNLPALIANLKQVAKLVIPDGLGAKIKELADALKNFSGFTIDQNLPILLSLLVKISKVNIPPELASRITDLAQAFATFGNISGTIGSVDKSITSLVNALAKLASADLLTAAQNLPVLTQAIQNLITAVNAGGGVNKSLTSLINALSKLAQTTTQANGQLTNLNLTVAKSPNHTARAVKGYNNIYMVLVKFRTLLWAVRTAWRALSSAIGDASSLVEVANVVGTVYSDTARQELEGLSKSAIQNYGMSELAFKQMASRFQAMGTAMGISNEAVAGAEENLKKWNILNKATGKEYGVMTGQMSDMSMTLTELAADIGSFYDTSVEDVQTALSAVYTGQTRPLTLAA